MVAQAQDPLVVRDDDEPHILLAGVAEHLGHAARVVRRDPDAAGVAHDMAEALARQAHGGRVHDGQELFEMVGQDPEEERLVAVLQRHEPDVPLEGIRLAADVLELEGDLLLDPQDLRREEAAQAERIPLLEREGGVLVEDLVAQQLHAPQRYGCGRAGSDCRVSRSQGTHGWTSCWMVPMEGASRPGSASHPVVGSVVINGR